MEPGANNLGQVVASSKKFARRLLAMGEIRLKLLMVEVFEERERLFRGFLLALGVAAFGMLAGITLTSAIVVVLWDYYSPVAILVTLTGLYGGTAFTLWRLLSRLLSHGRALSASLDELRKDRAGLEKFLS